MPAIRQNPKARRIQNAHLNGQNWLIPALWADF